MRKSSAHVFFIVGIVSLSTLWAAPPTTSHDPTTQPVGAARSDAPVRFSAIVPIGIGSNDDDYVQVIMQNVSRQPFYFVPGGPEVEPSGMYALLFRRNGEVVSGGRTPGWREITRADVRELKSGEQFEFRVHVSRAIYFDLKAGLYALHVRMKVTDYLHQQYGMTPIDIDQFVCHVRVPEPKPTTAPSTQPVK